MTAEPALLVIGGGPGGYVAALRAAQLGWNTTLVERESLGGVCLNWGCIPTKSLLHTADTLRRIRQAGDLGLRVAEPEIDFERVIAHSRAAAERLQRGVTYLLRKANVTVRKGHASFEPDGSVRIRAADGSESTCRPRHTLVATGARAQPLPSLPFDGRRVWSYRDALAARALPRTLLVIGAGAIGMEFASFYATLGSKVTVVEAQPRVLPGGDAEVSAFVAQDYARQGIAILAGARVRNAAVHGAGVRIELDTAQGAQQREAEHVLVAIGLAGNTEKLGLEHTRVQVDRGLIVAGLLGATAEPGISAIGDVTGAPMLAHRASHQALACVERLAGLRSDAHAGSAQIPYCIYGHPQVAGVGMSEEQAQGTGRPLRVGRFPLEANGKAAATGETAGFAKTIFDATTGQLLGAHIVGPDAPELIHGFSLAGVLEATEAELIDTVYPHPTLSEALHESVLAAFGRALHI